MCKLLTGRKQTANHSLLYYENFIPIFFSCDQIQYIVRNILASCFTLCNNFGLLLFLQYSQQRKNRAI